MSEPKLKPVVHQLRGRCKSCSRALECLPRALSPPSLHDYDNNCDNHNHILHAGDHLFNVGEPFEAIYVVRSGAFKGYRDNDYGHETVMALYLGTELMGLESVDSGVYQYSAVALETSSFCPVTPEQLRQVCQSETGVGENITHAISRELNKEQEHLLTILAHKTAYAQTAAFIINISARYKRLGYSWQEFRIPLSRWELASYLGLTVETISRTLHLLQKNGVIHLQGRIVKILNLPALKQATGNSECSILSD